MVLDRNRPSLTSSATDSSSSSLFLSKTSRASTLVLCAEWNLLATHRSVNEKGFLIKPNKLFLFSQHLGRRERASCEPLKEGKSICQDTKAGGEIPIVVLSGENSECCRIIKARPKPINSRPPGTIVTVTWRIHHLMHRSPLCLCASQMDGSFGFFCRLHKRFGQLMLSYLPSSETGTHVQSSRTAT